MIETTERLVLDIIFIEYSTMSVESVESVDINALRGCLE